MGFNGADDELHPGRVRNLGDAGPEPGTRERYIPYELGQLEREVNALYMGFQEFEKRVDALLADQGPTNTAIPPQVKRDMSGRPPLAITLNEHVERIASLNNTLAAMLRRLEI